MGWAALPAPQWRSAMAAPACSTGPNLQAVRLAAPARSWPDPFGGSADRPAVERGSGCSQTTWKAPARIGTRAAGNPRPRTKSVLVPGRVWISACRSGSSLRCLSLMRIPAQWPVGRSSCPGLRRRRVPTSIGASSQLDPLSFQKTRGCSDEGFPESWRVGLAVASPP